MPTLKNLTGLNVFVGIIIAAVVTVVGIGLYVAGSPSRERDRRFDEQRLNALQQISSTVQYYFERNNTLPQNLNELKTRPEYSLPQLTDPKTGEPYEYRVSGVNTYELCATFDLPSMENDPRYPKPLSEPYYGNPLGQEFWRHEAGLKCFTFDLTKPTRGSCVLMRDKESGRVGCFGCANRVCIDPPLGYDLYNAPLEEDYIGIPYRCFESEEGCALAQ